MQSTTTRMYHKMGRAGVYLKKTLFQCNSESICSYIDRHIEILLLTSRDALYSNTKKNYNLMACKRPNSLTVQSRLAVLSDTNKATSVFTCVIRNVTTYKFHILQKLQFLDDNENVWNTESLRQEM